MARSLDEIISDREKLDNEYHKRSEELTDEFEEAIKDDS